MTTAAYLSGAVRRSNRRYRERGTGADSKASSRLFSLDTAGNGSAAEPVVSAGAAQRILTGSSD